MKYYYKMMRTKSGSAPAGNHSNPHVLSAARQNRADGGLCEGGSAPKNLGKIGRMKGGRVKRAWGGALNPVNQMNPTANPVQMLQNTPGNFATGSGNKTMADPLGLFGGGNRDPNSIRQVPGGNPQGTLAGNFGRNVPLPPGRKSGGRTPMSDEPAATERVQKGMPGRRHGGKVSEKDMAAVGRDEIAEHKREHKIIDEEDDDDREGRANGGGTKKWMQGAVKRPGALREKLHVPEGKNIPAGKLEKATHSSDPLEKKEAVLAETFKHARKK